MTQAAGEAPALEVRGFSAGYSASDPKVVDASFSLARGSLTALVGPNGAGKSTLLKGILGLTPVHEPERVRFFGTALEHARDRVAYLPQRSELDWDFPATALDVACMGLYRRIGVFRRVTRAARGEARDALALVGLSGLADRPIGELSGGQRQRVLVARALAQRADLVLLDEPFANVDEPTERAIASLLRALAEGGTPILAVHHDLAMVRSEFDEAIVLDRTIRAHGRVAEALGNAVHGGAAHGGAAHGGAAHGGAVHGGTR